MEEKFKVGVIASPHGLKGEVKVFPTTDDAKRYKKLKAVFLNLESEMKLLTIEGIKFSGKFVVLKFGGLNCIEDALLLKGKELWIERKDAVKLRKDEYFVADLIDIKVINEDGQVLGTVKEVIHTGANDVYAVVTEAKKEILLPAIKECILDVDIENRVMKVHIMDGLCE
ncbi:MAG: ribosome maturation factor RimM [Lachnospiraceae bacterium]|nr:ribosome maturation factor RimM [Lachnospiraceae bacterium]